MNSSLVDFLHCQQQTQNHTTGAIQAIQQPERDHANDSFIDDTPTFDGKSELYYE